MKHELIEKIFVEPEAQLIVDEIQKKLNEEKRRRELFYNEITEYEKAEFINGEIVVHSPVKKRHNDYSFQLAMLMKTFVQKNDLGFVGHEKIMVTLSRNDYEPDICFFRKEKSEKFTPEQSLFPIPDLVVEVLSPATEKNDRELKFKDYEAHGVSEYWIVDAETKMLEQYQLQENEAYALQLKATEGTVQSSVIEGFACRIEAIFDAEENLKALEKLLRG